MARNLSDKRELSEVLLLPLSLSLSPSPKATHMISFLGILLEIFLTCTNKHLHLFKHTPLLH